MRIIFENIYVAICLTIFLIKYNFYFKRDDFINQDHMHKVNKLDKYRLREKKEGQVLE